jgi:plastocyanin
MITSLAAQIVRRSCLALVAILAVSASRPAAAADVSVDQVGQKFSPNSITVKVGDTVHFKNGDDVTHNIQVTDSDDSNEDEGLQKPGEEIKQTFDKAGQFSVHCAIHPRMKMTIAVKP